MVLQQIKNIQLILLFPKRLIQITTLLFFPENEKKIDIFKQIKRPLPLLLIVEPTKLCVFSFHAEATVIII